MESFLQSINQTLDVDGTLYQNMSMFLHLMINQIEILEVDAMTQLIGKMYKFSKYFHIIDTYKYIPAVKEDK